MNLFEYTSLLGFTACDAPAWQATHRLAYDLPLPPELVPVAAKIAGRPDPTRPGGYRRVVVVAGRGSAKTDNMAAVLVHGGLFGAFKGTMRKGRTIWQGFSAQNNSVAASGFEGIVSLLRQSEDVLRRKLIDSYSFTSSGGVITLRNSSMGFRVVTRDPDSARGFQWGDFVIDEAGAGAVGDDSARSVGRFDQSVRPRVSGRTWFVGTPGQFEGPLYQSWQRDRVAHAKTLYVTFPTWEGSPEFDARNPGVREEMKAIDPQLHDREFGALWIQMEGQWLDSQSLDRARRENPIFYGHEPHRRYSAVCDLAFKNDSSVLMIGSHTGERPIRIDFVRELQPKPGEPLSPKDTIAEFADDMRRFGITTVTGDAFYELSAVENFRAHGIHYDVASFAPAEKLRMFAALRSALLESSLELPPIDRLMTQLRELRMTFTSGGTARFAVPERKGHDDLAVCAALLVSRAFAIVTAPKPATRGGSVHIQDPDAVPMGWESSTAWGAADEPVGAGARASMGQRMEQLVNGALDATSRAQDEYNSNNRR